MKVVKSKWLKRFLIGTGGLVLILVVSALVIPFVIKIDQYRPQIVSAVNERINGNLEIGKLSLSLWGQVEIDIQGIRLSDQNGNVPVMVRETYAQISFLSILQGKPHLIFRMKEPKIELIKDKSGKINLLSLMKESEVKEDGSKPEAGKNGEKAEVKAGEIPFIDVIKTAGLDIELMRAQLSFQDLASDFSQEFQNFNLVLSDISMSRPMNLRIWADLATKVGESISVSGPFNIAGLVKPEFEGLDFRNVEIELDMNFDDLVISVGDLFKKAKAIPFNIKAQTVASTNRVEVKNLLFHFHNAELESSVILDKVQSASPELKFKLQSKPISLLTWDKLIPMLKDYELDGRLDLGANASGTLAKLEYEASLSLQDFILKAPGLLAKPKIQFNAQVVTNELREAVFKMEAPGTDLNVKANLKNFSAPNLTLTVDSNGIDLDQIIPKPSPTPDTDAPNARDAKVAAVKKTEPEPTVADVDAALDPLRSNEFVKSVVAQIVVRIKKFNGMNLTAHDIGLSFSFKNLVAAIESFNVSIFRGLIKANANIDLKPKSPPYSMNFSIKSLDLQRAIDSQLPSFRNTVTGQLSMKAQGGGKSLNSDQILKNLNINGNLKIADAKFSTIDTSKMVVEGLNAALQDIAKQIPGVKDQKVASLQNFKSRYKFISADFTLRGGVFLSENFETVSYPKEGIDLKGRTQADLVNDKLDAKWLIIDTYDMSKGRELEVNVSGKKVPHILAKGKDPVSFPVNVGCKLSAPCYDYAAVPKHLGGIALDNTRSAVKGIVNKELAKAKSKAKAETKKQKKKAEEKSKKALEKEADKLKKKFGF